MNNEYLKVTFDLDRKVTKSVFSDFSSRCLTFKRSMINATHYLNQYVNERRKMYLFGELVFSFNIDLDDAKVLFLLNGEDMFTYDISMNTLHNHSTDSLLVMRGRLERRLKYNRRKVIRLHELISENAEKLAKVRKTLSQIDEDCNTFKFLSFIKNTPYVKNREYQAEHLQEVIDDQFASIETLNEYNRTCTCQLEFLTDETFKNMAEYLSKEIHTYSGERVIVYD